MDRLLIEVKNFSEVLIPLGAAVGTFFLLLVVRWGTFRLLTRWASTARILKTFTLFWVIAIAVHVGVETSTLAPKYADLLKTFIQVLIIFSFTFAGSKLLEVSTENFFRRIESPLAHNGLFKVVIKIFVFIIGSLVALDRLGIHIAPLLTALGVGGLAVSLALQDTLSNLFAGLSLLLERAIKTGDRIKLESGTEGIIEDIGWRTTKLRLSPEDVVIIPNTKLAQNIATRRAPKAV